MEHDRQVQVLLRASSPEHDFSIVEHMTFKRIEEDMSAGEEGFGGGGCYLHTRVLQAAMAIRRLKVGAKPDWLHI